MKLGAVRAGRAAQPLARALRPGYEPCSCESVCVRESVCERESERERERVRVREPETLKTKTWTLGVCMIESFRTRARETVKVRKRSLLLRIRLDTIMMSKPET